MKVRQGTTSRARYSPEEAFKSHLRMSVNKDLVEDFHKEMIASMLELDKQPKNVYPIVPPKGKEYEYMCMELSQGFELDWIKTGVILVNEFCEPEHIDDFMKRHPNFAEDIKRKAGIFKNLIKKYARR